MKRYFICWLSKWWAVTTNHLCTRNRWVMWKNKVWSYWSSTSRGAAAACTSGMYITTDYPKSVVTPPSQKCRSHTRRPSTSPCWRFKNTAFLHISKHKLHWLYKSVHFFFYVYIQEHNIGCIFNLLNVYKNLGTIVKFL